MRSYGQFCGLAKALDVIGDRWSLLIVRELLLSGPLRYTDLLHGLPGIATNLLADRLRTLEERGIVARESAPPPIATTLFSLTARGVQLESALLELGRWGGALLGAPEPGDEFRAHWLGAMVRMHLRDNAPEQAPVAIEIRTGDEPVVIEARDGRVTLQRGASPDPHAVLAGPPHLVVAVLLGRLSLNAATSRGVRYVGARSALRRVRPAAPSAERSSR